MLGATAAFLFLISLTLTCASRQQALAFFPRLNFQKRSDADVFFSKSGSRHNGVQFLIAQLTRWLRTRGFSEPTFRPSGATKHWINTLFCDFLPFRARLHLLSSGSFCSLIFFLLPFSSVTVPTSAFPSPHIVGSLTSKLPSITYNTFDNLCKRQTLEPFLT